MAKCKHRWKPQQRGKRTRLRSTRGVTPALSAAVESIRASELVLLITELWRMQQRAQQEPVPERFALALERSLERVMGLGFEIRSLVGEPYDTHMSVTVIDDRGGEPKHVLECLTPAIYYRGKLLERANVVIGGDTNG